MLLCSDLRPEIAGSGDSSLHAFLKYYTSSESRWTMRNIQIQNQYDNYKNTRVDRIKTDEKTEQAHPSEFSSSHM